MNKNFPHNNPKQEREQQALALIQQGKLQEAEAIYRSLIDRGSENYITYGNLAAICGMTGRREELIHLLKKALDLKPDFPEAQNNLGLALMEEGNLAVAIGFYHKALELKPNFPDALNNLAVALEEQGNLGAAIDSYRKALELRPNYPEAQYNLGNALGKLGDHASAIAAYQKALELKPGYPDAHFNLSTSLLRGGSYQLGWEEYEWRSKKPNDPVIPHAQPKSRQWTGETLSTNAKLLMVSEQGLGDTLHFMRYALHLKNQGLEVSLCAQPELHRLIQASGIDPEPLSPEQANSETEGYWIPLLSVPRHLEISPEKPVITEPYITTSAELADKWGDILAPENRPIIALNWQGNPMAEKSNVRGRSLPLEIFSPITSRHQGTLLSLQKGFGSEQLETCSFRDRFVACQEQVNKTRDFLETAAIIANCDLVITSDTAVAHLAGGMGKTTWLLLHTSSEWRWGMEGDTTFWYPSMRLFRQNEPGNWAEVMERVAAELQKVF